MAKPTLFNDKVANAILKDLRNGLHRAVAARRQAIGPRTVADWMAKGRSDAEQGLDTPLARFRNEVIKAEADAEEQVVACVRGHATTDPEIGLKFLSVRWRKRWNLKHQIEIEGGKRPLRIEHALDLSKLTAQQLEQLEAIVEAAGASDGPEGDE
jgi:transposase